MGYESIFLINHQGKVCVGEEGLCLSPSGLQAIGLDGADEMGLGADGSPLQDLAPSRIPHWSDFCVPTSEISDRAQAPAGFPC